MDTMRAGTAEVHGLTLLTRNESDFQPTLKSIIIPWS
jgi:predicted nucleic acid-binding protein